MAGESVCEQEHCLTPVVWLAGGQWVPVSCASSTFILLERALLGSGWAQENAFFASGQYWFVLMCFIHLLWRCRWNKNVLGEGVQGRRRHKWGLELVTITIFLLWALHKPSFFFPARQQKGCFFSREIWGENEIKTVGLMWEQWRTRKMTTGKGKQQHEHACCRAETPQQHLHTPQLGTKCMNSIPPARKVGNWAPVPPPTHSSGSSLQPCPGNPPEPSWGTLRTCTALGAPNLISWTTLK